jgi:predicted alpha/beta hydrolase family esterase
MTRYLIVPGWANSGPTHWQSHWERELPGAARVEMSDWLEPRRSDWIATLDLAIRGAAEPPILIAHSLGCLAVAHWAARHDAPVRGALLVTPADVERAGCPDHLRDFAPVPRAELPFSSHVVASTNDPYASLAWTFEIADAWASNLTILRGAGHVNPASGFGPWSAGRALLEGFATIGDRAEEASGSSVLAPLADAARR